MIPHHPPHLTQAAERTSSAAAASLKALKLRRTSVAAAVCCSALFGRTQALIEGLDVARVTRAEDVETQSDAPLGHEGQHLRRQLEPSVDAPHRQVANQVHC